MVANQKHFKDLYATLLLVFLSCCVVLVELYFSQNTVIFGYEQSAELMPTNMPHNSYIVVKYKTAPSEGIDNKISSVLGSRGAVEPSAFTDSNSTLEHIEANKKKYPERAARVPPDAVIPDLSLVRTIKANNRMTDAIISDLQSDPNVEYAIAQENMMPTALPIDPIYNVTRPLSGGSTSDTWALRKIGLNPTDDGDDDSGWDDETGSSDIVVAVYGTGIDYLHPDLAENIWVNPGEDIDHDGVVADTGDLNGLDDDMDGYIDDLIGWSFSNSDRWNVYDNGSQWGGHDTSVAGTIGAVGNNSVGSAGVGWNFKLMAVQYGGYAESVIYAADAGADIINFSWSGRGGGIKEAIDYAYANGMIVVFSSGNENLEFTGYDGTFSEHLWIIGGTSYDDTRASYSSYGKRLDFTAPSNGVLAPRCTETQANSGMFTQSPFSLIADSQGNPTLAYFDPQNDLLKYGKYENSVWSFETVESGGWAGIYPSLVLDESGNPHISYYDWDDRKLKYATKSGGTWSIEDVTSTDDQGYYSTLRIGTDGKPRIVYTDATNRLLKYTIKDGGVWLPETVANNGGTNTVGDNVSLELDSLDNPFIAYWKSDTSDLMYAKKVDGVWQSEAVDTAGNVGMPVDLVLDNSGNPHIAYSDSANWDLKYAYWDGSWHTEIVQSTGYSGYIDVQIHLDSSGYSHMLSTTYDGLIHLTYASQNGSGWVLESIGTSSPYLGYFHDFVLVNDSPILITNSGGSGLYLGTKTDQWNLTEAFKWGNPYQLWGGTSFATPLAVGLAGLLMSEHPGWNLNQIYWAVASTAKDLGTAGFDKYYGWGRIDAKKALDLQEPLVDTTAPVAEITSPANGDLVTVGGSLNIIGSASDSNFTYYNLYYQRPNDSSWYEIEWYNRTQKSSDVLGILNLANVPHGTINLKLVTHDFYQSTTKELSFLFAAPDSSSPYVTLSQVSPNPSANVAPIIYGIAEDSISLVTSVEYQVDSKDGEWFPCVAEDSVFNTSREPFHCSLNKLQIGTHTIYIRSSDNRGNTTNYSSIPSQVITITKPSIEISPKIFYWLSKRLRIIR